MAADKPPAERNERPGGKPESRLDAAAIAVQELREAHGYLDRLNVPRPERDGEPAPIEERLRALFGDRPRQTDAAGSLEERVAALEVYLTRVWGYLMEREREGNARIASLERWTSTPTVGLGRPW